MKHPFIFKSRRLPRIGTLFLLGAGVALACGPDFPNCYLDLSEREMLAAPEGYFAVEIARLAPSAKARVIRDESKEDTREWDELRLALSRRGETAAQVDRMVEAYRNWRTPRRGVVVDGEGSPAAAPPEGLPVEFAHYLNGAAAWHRNDVAGARGEWLALLALPASERCFRSTWAAFMLGRSEAKDGNAAAAQRWFAETRALAAAGFADSINLAGASLGIEARQALATQDFARAMGLYLDQHGTGDESAYASLRMAAAAAANGDEKQLDDIAREPRARGVLTAWFLARFGATYGDELALAPLRSWTDALVKAEVQDVESADRLAWLAYEAGDFDLAKAWAELALDRNPETHWIRAKLFLRDDRLGDGARELGRAADSPNLAPIYRSVILGELGRVLFALDRREAALTAWINGGHWEDAAYVAERIMTIDELKLFLASHQPAGRPVFAPYTGEVVTPETWDAENGGLAGWWTDGGTSLEPRLAGLLARRLVRAGRTAEARVYFNAESRCGLAAYVSAVQDGFNVTLRPKTRARAFWRAAQLVREQGMELMGTELTPDFFIWGGSFAYGGDERRFLPDAGRFAATKEEIDRLARNATPTQRFSYRYRAADLAWWAASLLPNDDNETAAILNTAGGWLKSRDPIAANRFYQALVIRCGRTSLGRSAGKLHWFPPDF